MKSKTGVLAYRTVPKPAHRWPDATEPPLQVLDRSGGTRGMSDFAGTELAPTSDVRRGQANDARSVVHNLNRIKVGGKFLG